MSGALVKLGLVVSSAFQGGQIGAASLGMDILRTRVSLLALADLIHRAHGLEMWKLAPRFIP